MTMCAVAKTQREISEAVAALAIAQYETGGDTVVQLLSLSENATFIVKVDGRPHGILRVYRDGYQTETEIASELCWIQAIQQDGVVETPGLIHNRDGAALTRVYYDGEARHVVVFEYVEGEEPDAEDLGIFGRLGRIAASLHLHEINWTAPRWFQRSTWNLETILGPAAPWGDWRNCPGVGPAELSLLEELEHEVAAAVGSYPQTRQTFGLIHADLRAANLLRSGDSLTVIDFDDSGISWRMWDLASVTTLIEDHPQIDAIVGAWLEGYRTVRPISPADLLTLPALVMLRRLHLMAWLGTHPESGLFAEFGAEYAERTCLLARRFLDGSYLAGLT